MPKRVYTDAYVSFRVISETLDPLDVTLALRMPPDRTHRRGEPRLHRGRKGVTEYAPYGDGHWSMCSRAWVDGAVLDTHLRWMLDELEPHAEALRTLQEAGHHMDFFCFSAGSTKELPPVQHETRRRADSLGLEIVIDHYGD